MALQGNQELLAMHLSPPLVPAAGALGTPTLTQMVERIAQTGPQSGAEALRSLRAVFPDTPLALRVAALEMLQRLGRARPPGGILR